MKETNRLWFPYNGFKVYIVEYNNCLYKAEAYSPSCNIVLHAPYVYFIEAQQEIINQIDKIIELQRTVNEIS